MTPPLHGEDSLELGPSPDGVVFVFVSSPELPKINGVIFMGKARVEMLMKDISLLVYFRAFYHRFLG